MAKRSLVQSLIEWAIFIVLFAVCSGGCAPSDQSLECTVNYLDGNVVEDGEAHLGPPMALVDFTYDPIDADNFGVPGRVYAGTLEVKTNRSVAFEWVIRFLFVNFGIDADGDGNYGEPELASESPANFASIPIACDWYDGYGSALSLSSFSPTTTHGEALAEFSNEPETDLQEPDEGEVIEGVPVPHKTKMYLGCTRPSTDKKITAFLPKADSATWGMVEYYNRSIVPVVFTNNGTALNGTPPVLNPSPMN